MKHNTKSLHFVLLLALILLVSAPALAHCDTMDGPVVKAAKAALKTKNVNLVLIWVPQKNESEVIQSFQQTLIVRRLGPDAKQLADRFFFETVVRIHRAGEGEPYTGLKPAGTDLGPVIPVADKAIDTGAVAPLLKLFPEKSQVDIQTRFADTISKKNYDQNNVAEGRRYVGAYVSFLQFLEHLYEQKSAETAS